MASRLLLKMSRAKLVCTQEIMTIKKTWSNKQDPKQAESVITLKGPSVPLAVYSYSANMKVEDWEDSVFVSAQKGEIMALNNQADWQVSLKQGSFVSRNHKGNIKVKGFRLKVFLEKSQGASEESEGLFDFKFNEGSMQVQGGKGKLVFFSDKAPLTLRSFEGSLQANTGSGNILGVLKPKQVEAFSDKGTLNFYFRKQGAKVEASTKGGKMFAPRYFNKKFQGRSVTAKGRLQGFPKEGQVSLRTNTGNIYFY